MSTNTKNDEIVRPARTNEFFCDPPLHVVLVEPEIPPNTGNVARMCYATGTILHLIKPLGFDISEKRLRRAGLDYWKKMDVQVHEHISDFVGPIVPAERCIFFSTRATKPFWEAHIQPGDALIFGKESRGLGDELREKYEERLFHIPIADETVRSINLSNSVAITLFDSYRRISNIY